MTAANIVPEKKFEKLKCYLAGSIQDSKDGGVGWREKLTKSLLELGFDVLDPTTLECNHTLAMTIEEQKKKLENLKRGGEWNKYKEVISEIRRSDLVCVNSSKFLIVLYDTTRRYGGTIHEIVEAWQKNIPMYVVSYDPKTDFNDWVFGLFLDNEKNGGKIYPNFKQLTDFLEVEYKDYIKQHGEWLKLQEQVVKQEAVKEVENKDK